MEMNSQYTKPNGPVGITSGTPGQNRVPLGRALQALTDSILCSHDSAEGLAESGEELELFLQKHERFADTERLQRISPPHAIKAWAAERLPSVGISYGLSNRLTHEAAVANADERASLSIVQFADDLAMIARYCRRITNLQIEASIHSQGLEFRFRFNATPLGEPFDELERRGIQDLLRHSAKENCLKSRVIATNDAIEAQSIVLRQRVRLGFNPLNN